MTKEIVETIKESLPILLICAGVTMGVIILIEEAFIYIKERKDGKK